MRAHGFLIKWAGSGIYYNAETSITYRWECDYDNGDWAMLPIVPDPMAIDRDRIVYVSYDVNSSFDNSGIRRTRSR